MANLRVHIIYGKEIHLEGEEIAVRELLDKFGPNTPSSTPNNQIDFSLSQVVSQALAHSEPEWLLVYAASFTKSPFTRHDILLTYKSTQRYSSNRSKNLSFNLRTCVKNGWFNAINDNAYTLSSKGSLHLQEILTRSRN